LFWTDQYDSIQLENYYLALTYLYRQVTTPSISFCDQ
jgi:hypothetical protein